MACISAETGTMVFAVFNIVVVTISSVLGVGLLGYWFFMTFVYADRVDPEICMKLLAAILTHLGMSLVCLMFASFLMNGILKKKPEHIKLYYVYGVVMIILSFAAFLGACVSMEGVIDPIAVCVILLCYSIYALILYMIRRTYVQYETNYAQFGHRPLNEKC